MLCSCSYYSRCFTPFVSVNTSVVDNFCVYILYAHALVPNIHCTNILCPRYSLCRSFVPDILLGAMLGTVSIFLVQNSANIIVPNVLCARYFLCCNVFDTTLCVDIFIATLRQGITCEGVCQSPPVQCIKKSRTNAAFAFFSLRAACNRKVAEHNALCDQVSGLKS